MNPGRLLGLDDCLAARTPPELDSVCALPVTGAGVAAELSPIFVSSSGEVSFVLSGLPFVDDVLSLLDRRR